MSKLSWFWRCTIAKISQILPFVSSSAATKGFIQLYSSPVNKLWCAKLVDFRFYAPMVSNLTKKKTVQVKHILLIMDKRATVWLEVQFLLLTKKRGKSKLLMCKVRQGHLKCKKKKPFSCLMPSPYHNSIISISFLAALINVVCELSQYY